jgi:hypothetical protein
MGKVIWTTHLRERIKQRGLNPSWVDTAVRFPDEVQQSSTTNSKKHIKTINGYKIVAAVVRQGSDWVITSAWWNPVYGNTSTYSKKNDNRTFLEKWIYNGILAIEKLIKNKK